MFSGFCYLVYRNHVGSQDRYDQEQGQKAFFGQKHTAPTTYTENSILARLDRVDDGPPKDRNESGRVFIQSVNTKTFPGNPIALGSGIKEIPTGSFVKVEQPQHHHQQQQSSSSLNRIKSKHKRRELIPDDSSIVGDQEFKRTLPHSSKATPVQLKPLVDFNDENQHPLTSHSLSRSKSLRNQSTPLEAGLSREKSIKIPSKSVTPHRNKTITSSRRNQQTTLKRSSTTVERKKSVRRSTKDDAEDNEPLANVALKTFQQNLSQK
jgi:hypothetical protein